ncbi:two-component hybrid sensor and regulator [Anabaenopsis circularis NIES-21]|uniref:Two-component hybrid sensor and regulator n=1 Tax=Anabaenopsis circularis NIES-21 TaxID=1085406 RepID=A0A1Z4GC09_9CYAN|nr:two-component hybrid sensor and regulator [Anabaenopsis circularis NIES-21]
MIRNLSSTETNKKIQILVVENDYILALNLQEILETLGYIVIDTVDSAELAIEKSHQFRPDLILMDIQLAGEMNGIEAAEKIWDNLQIPSIYVTGYADKILLERVTKNYPFIYIFKPATKQELDEAIQNYYQRSLRFNK